MPGYPHHVTQRGNRRQETFFCDDDYQAYLDLIRRAKKRVLIANAYFIPWRALTRALKRAACY